MNRDIMGSLCITLRADRAAILFPLLQSGLAIRTDTGPSLEAFLTELLGVSTHYIDERIRTILLDGKPVDDLGTAAVGNGSMLALSAAMPGLAGATLRRGGHLASFREGITHQSRGDTASPHPGIVTVKFFNVLIRELGMPLLQKGFSVRGTDLATMVTSLLKESPDSCTRVVLDSREMDVLELLSESTLQKLIGDDMWLLRIGLR